MPSTPARGRPDFGHGGSQAGGGRELGSILIVLVGTTVSAVWADASVLLVFMAAPSLIALATQRLSTAFRWIIAFPRQTILLEVIDAHKAFGRQDALRGVTLRLEWPVIVVTCPGKNGAGRVDASASDSVGELLALVTNLKSATTRQHDLHRPLGVEALLHRQLGSLALGQERRCMLASGLLGNPTLYLVDEFTNGLDPTGMSVLFDLPREEMEAGCLVATHDFADRLEATRLRMESGALKAD